jgi:hypothetical protein
MSLQKAVVTALLPVAVFTQLTQKWVVVQQPPSPQHFPPPVSELLWKMGRRSHCQDSWHSNSWHVPHSYVIILGGGFLRHEIIMKCNCCFLSPPCDLMKTFYTYRLCEKYNYLCLCVVFIHLWKYFFLLVRICSSPTNAACLVQYNHKNVTTTYFGTHLQSLGSVIGHTIFNKRGNVCRT